MKKRTNTTAYISMDSHHCVACWECIGECSKNVIGRVSILWHKHAIIKNAEACIGCMKCVKICPQGVFRGLNENHLF